MASDVEKARDILEKAITDYRNCKFTLSEIVDSADVVSTERLFIEMERLEDAIKQLNCTHTIWVCRSELPQDELGLHKYSKAWLESEWDECFDIQDKAENILYPINPVQHSTTSGSFNILSTSSDGSSDLVSTSDAVNMFLTLDGWADSYGFEVTVLTSANSASVFLRLDFFGGTKAVALFRLLYLKLVAHTVIIHPPLALVPAVLFKLPRNIEPPARYMELNSILLQQYP